MPFPAMKLSEDSDLAGEAPHLVWTEPVQVPQLERRPLVAVAIADAVHGSDAAAAGWTVDLKAVGKQAARG